MNIANVGAKTRVFLSKKLTNYSTKHNLKIFLMKQTTTCQKY